MAHGNAISAGAQASLTFAVGPVSVGDLACIGCLYGDDVTTAQIIDATNGTLKDDLGNDWVLTPAAAGSTNPLDFTVDGDLLYCWHSFITHAGTPNVRIVASAGTHAIKVVWSTKTPTNAFTLDQNLTSHHNGTPGGSLASGSQTPTTSLGYAFNVFGGVGSLNSFTAGSGFAERDETSDGWVVFQDDTYVSTALLTGSATSTASVENGGILALFKDAAAGGGSVAPAANVAAVALPVVPQQAAPTLVLVARAPTTLPPNKASGVAPVGVPPVLPVPPPAVVVAGARRVTPLPPAKAAGIQSLPADRAANAPQVVWAAAITPPPAPPSTVPAAGVKLVVLPSGAPQPSTPFVAVATGVPIYGVVSEVGFVDTPDLPPRLPTAPIPVAGAITPQVASALVAAGVDLVAVPLPVGAAAAPLYAVAAAAPQQAIVATAFGVTVVRLPTIPGVTASPTYVVGAPQPFATFVAAAVSFVARHERAVAAVLAPIVVAGRALASSILPAHLAYWIGTRIIAFASKHQAPIPYPDVDVRVTPFPSRP